MSTTTDMRTLEEIGVHPVAAMFPLLDATSERYRKLVTSIERNGQWQPIVLDSEGRVLDGRNRLRVCNDAQVEPRFINFADLNLGLNEDGDPVTEEEFAFDQNFARRDLTDDQRVAIYAQYGEYLDAAATAKEGNTNASKKRGDEIVPSFSKVKTRKKLADKAGVSEHKAQQALNVARKAPDLAKQVAAGELKLVDAAKQVATAAEASHESTAFDQRGATKRRSVGRPKTGKKAEAMQRELAEARARGVSIFSTYARLTLQAINSQTEFDPLETVLLIDLTEACNRQLKGVVARLAEVPSPLGADHA